MVHTGFELWEERGVGVVKCPLGKALFVSIRTSNKDCNIKTTFKTRVGQ